VARLGLFALLAAALTLPASGCSSGSGHAHAPAAKEEAGSPAARRAAAIYVAVVRQLVTKDNTFPPGTSPFQHVFVLDHAFTRNRKLRRLSREVKALIIRRLVDLQPFDFVGDPKSVIDPHRGCAVVKDHGVLVTLGTISNARAGRVHVRGQIFFACLGAAAATYVLEPAQRRWRVVGTVGGRAIA
jgi:hypothetical protein